MRLAGKGIGSFVFHSPRISPIAQPLPRWCSHSRSASRPGAPEKVDVGICFSGAVPQQSARRCSRERSRRFFLNVARESGLNAKTIYGGEHKNKYLLETTGCGVAFYDYDHDGWLDIFLVNGWRLEGFPCRTGTHSHLFKNNRDGTFTDVTAKAGLAPFRLGARRLRRRLRQRRLRRSLRHLLRQKRSLSQQRQRHLHRRQRKGGRRRKRQALEHRLRFRGLRSRRPPRSLRRQLHRPGPEDRAGSRIRPLPLQRRHGRLRSARTRTAAKIFFITTTATEPSPTSAKIRNPARPTALSASACSPPISTTTAGRTFMSPTIPPPARSIRTRRTERSSISPLEAGCALSADGKPQAGMGISAADYDLDGNLDLVKTNFAGDTPRSTTISAARISKTPPYQGGLGKHTQYLGWGCGFFDMDNDGWPDILICATATSIPKSSSSKPKRGYPQRKLLYQQSAQRALRRCVHATPARESPCRSRARGCAFGDFDNDGDIDMVVNTVNDYPQLLRCDSRTGNNWIKIRTIGTKSNRSGIGARIKCVTHLPGETKSASADRRSAQRRRIFFAERSARPLRHGQSRQSRATRNPLAQRTSLKR